MKLTGLLLLAVVGWTSLGAIGIVLSLARNRREEAMRHAQWLSGVLGIYFIVLIAFSASQPQKLFSLGEDKCFGKMCFAAIKVDEAPGLIAGDTSRVVRVAIRVSNHGASANADGQIRAYLVDSMGRTWEPLPGLSGNRLRARVAAGSAMLSQPIFRVAGDSTALALVLTHGHWQPGRFIIGDSDSLAHKPDIVPLER